ncbi:uncharacterized protein N7477_000047 [Penicillium maclennaniae]|uniref:uncharacterized protein n=1 Tax=Penicillium maclennaniae TaxID=1343394 RepID=UPI0025411A03|nr:uncharacterized protein N7477_000047 [Penicillium maclennaniae]KAJ5683702.1 hypothetical protein N7477_000047 [Penicillium maclennaniae]
MASSAVLAHHLDLVHPEPAFTADSVPVDASARCSVFVSTIGNSRYGVYDGTVFMTVAGRYIGFCRVTADLKSIPARFIPYFFHISSVCENIGHPISWVGVSFWITSNSIQLIKGRLSDILGRKTCLIFAMVIMALGNIALGLSRTKGELLTAQAFSGIGAGAINALIQIAVPDYTSLEQMGSQFGIIGIGEWTGPAGDGYSGL